MKIPVELHEDRVARCCRDSLYLWPLALVWFTEPRSYGEIRRRRDGALLRSCPPFGVAKFSYLLARAMEFAELLKRRFIKEVKLRRGKASVSNGNVHLTSHHLIFMPEPEEGEELWLLYSHVSSMEWRVTSANCFLTVLCRTLVSLQLEFKCAEDCTDVVSAVETLSRPASVEDLYPFFFRSRRLLPAQSWRVDLHAELERMGCADGALRVSDVNQGFKVCLSYPEKVIVPASVEDSALIRAAKFRQHGRFPVVCYLHKNNQALLLRCGQPLCGPRNHRCSEDEALVNATLSRIRRGYIMETRSPGAIQQHRSRGGGTEVEAHYPQWRRMHSSLDNLESLHESYDKLMSACGDVNSSTSSWLSRLESCNWLGHVANLLQATHQVAQIVGEDGDCVLVHGIAGWDTSLQVTALTQVLLDPYCRTYIGFQQLVEREWLQPGHPFSLRCGHTSSTKASERSPVFLLFLDAVWQVLNQYPCSFEFNERLLIKLFEHAYVSEFGNFLGNCERERLELDLHNQTVSLWSYFLAEEVRDEILNPAFYTNNSVLAPSSSAQAVELWRGLYLRMFRGDCHNEDTLWSQARRLKARHADAERTVAQLQQEFLTLQTVALSQKNESSTPATPNADAT